MRAYGEGGHRAGELQKDQDVQPNQNQGVVCAINAGDMHTREGLCYAGGQMIPKYKSYKDHADKHNKTKLKRHQFPVPKDIAHVT